MVFRLLFPGIVLGMFGTWLARRAMQGILFGVPSLPVGAAVVTALVMAAASLAACLIPSQRAASISPLEALSED